MRPRSADEANETSLDVVVDDGGRGPVLEQEDQVAVVEVVSLSKKRYLVLIQLSWQWTP